MKFLNYMWSLINSLLGKNHQVIDSPNNIIEGLNEQIAKVSRDPNTKYITLPSGEFTIDYNIVLRNNVHLRSEDITTIYLYPSDSTSAAIYCERGTRAYAENNSLENIRFILRSPAKAVLQTNRSLRTTIKDCFFDAQGLTDHCIIVGDEGRKGAIGSDIIRTECLRANKGAIHYIDTGNTHRLYRTSLRKSGMGITGTVKGLELYACQVEDNMGLNIDLSGQSIDIHHTYFENSGMSIVSNDYVNIHNSRMSDGMVNINAPFVNISMNRIFGGSVITGPVSGIISGNWYENPRAYEFMREEFTKNNSLFVGNYTGQ